MSSKLLAKVRKEKKEQLEQLLQSATNVDAAKILDTVNQHYKHAFEDKTSNKAYVNERKLFSVFI